ncbi:hypothetical protein V502_11515 [Pseudogymnoascus sp. VKM F-4520 (FW-2644)]|nr:hypothetical protein V502_11515 [Pseudogymnoascus sp. VKM F-4520 (FW-2644)]
MHRYTSIANQRHYSAPATGIPKEAGLPTTEDRHRDRDPDEIPGGVNDLHPSSALLWCYYAITGGDQQCPLDVGRWPAQLNAAAAGPCLDFISELANTITLNRITSKIKQTPAIDLSHLLKQQATTYPQLRNILVQEAHRRLTTCTTKEEPPNNDSSTSSPAKLHGLLISGDVEITHPLDQRILVHAGIHSSGSESPSADIHTLTTGLNQALQTSQVLWNLHSSFVLSLGRCEVVKIGTSLDADGAANLEYINTHVPGIPTPSFLGSLTSGRRTYCFMSRANDVTLESVWPSLTTANKVSVQRQLNNIFRILRAKSANIEGAQRIGSFTSTTCKDTRRSQRATTVPIRTEAEFNDFLCHKPGRTATPWIQMIRSAMGERHGVVRTHGDLHPRKIMVEWTQDDMIKDHETTEKRIRVTSLLDWEMGGWYPEYWEFVKAVGGVSRRGLMADWVEYLPTGAIGVWPVEYAVDSLLSRWLG